MRGILGGVEVHVPKNHLEEPAVIDESRHEPFLVVRSECGALPYELVDEENSSIGKGAVGLGEAE